MDRGIRYTKEYPLAPKQDTAAGYTMMQSRSKALDGPQGKDGSDIPPFYPLLKVFPPSYSVNLLPPVHLSIHLNNPCVLVYSLPRSLRYPTLHLHPPIKNPTELIISHGNSDAISLNAKGPAADLPGPQ